MGKTATPPAARKKSKAKTDDALASRALKGEFHPHEGDGKFGFARLYWPDGDGPRASLEGHLAKKRHPAGTGARHRAAARMEVLLPPDAPEEYVDIDRLVQRYEEALPSDASTAIAQVTLHFPDAPNLHSKYEESRAWVREHFVLGMRLPVILVLHAPYLVGSDVPGHVHALVLTAKLSRFGWIGIDEKVSSDAGRKAALRSWKQYQKECSTS
ncbi:hypothetical protein WJS89_05645 [Sphingomicrobium sp. XHP0235]|uniref:hypothetical protein n=1 Tax=Sphingomicrobium aquimarinum TaxID=3133971 RepID=UPI0031FEB9C6